MGKIKLSNDQELNIVADGIQEAGDSLIITLTTEKTITEYDELFSDSNNTRKVTVLDSTGDPFLIHSGLYRRRSKKQNSGYRNCY